MAWSNDRRLHTLKASHHLLYKELRDIGVRDVSCVPSNAGHPAGFYLVPTWFWYYIPDIERLPEFVEEYLSSSEAKKLLRQLSDAADVDERHAFLVLGMEERYAAPLDTPGVALPTQAPNLVAPIDGVWVTTASTRTEGVAARLVG